MVPAIRKQFNANFTEEKYQQYLKDIDNLHPGALDFRVAETPVFVPKAFTTAMLDACESILDVIEQDNFLQLTERSIPKQLHVANEKDFSEFLIFDFGVCIGTNGEPEPQLIEMQAFPSLFAYQSRLSDITDTYANVPDNFSPYLGNFTRESYLADLKKIILSDQKPEETILLEIYPKTQKTRIDFYCTSELTGIRTVCLSELMIEGSSVFYLRDGVKTRVKRIFNRLIFDDLHQQEDWKNLPDITQDLDVEWLPHPNWFYRVSKYTLPFIQHPNVPETFFLNELTRSVNLEHYVLKPLFSFAGMGVIIDVTQEDIDKIEDPENYILQKKVHYAPILETPDEPAKVEIRLFYFKEGKNKRAKAAHNLARISKGKMIGTRYNKDKTWVGGTVAYFEK